MSASQPASVGPSKRPYLLSWVKAQLVAVPCQNVRQVVLMPNVTALPSAPAHLAGVINLRGMVIPLLDLRVLFGLPPTAQEHAELDALLNARLQDHRKWLAELEACTAEKREFKLARDPHKCAFGKWYDAYQPQNTTITFNSIWRALDAPHQKIHAIADVALGHAQRGEYEQARRIIDQTRDGPLHELVRLFAEASVAARQTSREVAIVLCLDNQHVAISADKVDRAEEIDDSAMESTEACLPGVRCELVRQIARRGEDQPMALVLDAPTIFAQLPRAAKAAA